MRYDNQLGKYSGLVVNVHENNKLRAALTPVVSNNSYEVFDPSNGDLVLCAHEQSSALSRTILGRRGPSVITISGGEFETLLLVRLKPFVLAPKAEIWSPQGDRVGTIKARAALMERRLNLRAGNEELATIHGHRLSPWQFTIRQRGTEVAAMSALQGSLNPQISRADDSYYLEYRSRETPETDRLWFLGTSLMLYSIYIWGQNRRALIRSTSMNDGVYEAKEQRRNREFL